MKIVLLVCVAWAVVGLGCAGGRMSGDQLRTSGVVFDRLPTGEKFAVYVPRGDAPKEGWPCVVFLNGSGECGTDGQRQLTQGLMPAALNKPDEWPFVIVFPQKPTQKSKWVEHKDMVMACLEQTRGKWSVDAARLYLTGLSQGGNGTWEIAASSPGVFAAIAPVCGYGEAARIAPGLERTPIWAFHGEKDDVVKPEQTRWIVAAIGAERAVKADELQRDDGKAGTLRMTVYPDLNHGCWDRAYRDSGMSAWFLRFSRP
jgi:predicted peptidase